jgi:hypothetical protein
VWKSLRIKSLTPVGNRIPLSGFSSLYNIKKDLNRNMVWTEYEWLGGKLMIKNELWRSIKVENL